MGGVNKRGFKIVYISKGKMVRKTGEDSFEEFNGWKGRLVGISKYESKSGDYAGNISINIKLWDYEEKAFVTLNFSEGTMYYSGFFGRIENVDFTKDIYIGTVKPDKPIPGVPEERRAKMQYCTIRQPDEDGEVISKVANFEERFRPETHTSKKGKKETDYEGVIEEVDKMLPLLNDLIKKGLVKNPIIGVDDIPEDDTAEHQTKTNATKSKADEVSDDDLPF